MKYNELNWGQMEAIVNKLGGMEGVARFLSGETVVKAIEQTFKVWKTIKLGTHKDVNALKKAITKAGCKIGDWANDMLGKEAFTIAPTEQEIDLVVVTVGELGFKNGAKYSDICQRAQELGLELCPNEVGPQLRLQYKDQPKGEWLRIAMEPITDSGGDRFIFRVAHGVNDLWLYWNYGNPGHVWDAGLRFVFVLRKKN